MRPKLPVLFYRANTPRSYKQTTAKQQEECQEQAFFSSLQCIFWIPSLCYSPLSREVVTEFQTKVKQLNYTLCSKEQFIGGNAWNQCSYFRWVTVSGQYPLQCAPDVSRGFYMLPPCKLIVIIRDTNFTTEIRNKDKELSLFITWYFSSLSCNAWFLEATMSSEDL